MALYVEFEERQQQHLTFPGRKNEVQMIFEVSEKIYGKKSLIFYSIKNYKLHACFDVAHFEDCIQLITKIKS